MPNNETGREEIINRLTERFRKLLENKLPDEPGTLEEIERVTEEIGKEVRRDVENECVSDHGSGYVGPRLACSCGREAIFKTHYDKRVVTLSSELVISRAYYHCAACGHGFAPLDEKLELDRLCTSVGVRTKVARLAAWIPFNQVSVELEELCGVHLSRNTAMSVSEGMGGLIREENLRREKLVVSGLAEASEAKPKRLYVGIDGTGAPMRGGGTREVKTGVIYQTVERDGKSVVVDPGYLATLERTECFGEQVYAAAYDRGVENAEDIVALGDGAPWIWKSHSHHYPKAVQILDYYHACEHLNEVARAWYGEGTDRAKRWVDARQVDLLSDCVETVIRSIQSWRPTDEDAKEVRRTNLAYFITNKKRMRYATFKAEGYHIGSGLVESACKMVVGQRLKQSGMRWSQPGAEAMLSLRCHLLTCRNADLRSYARAIT